MDLKFENRFWLQILGDHMRFLLKSLPSKEIDLIERVDLKKKELDILLEQSRKVAVETNLIMPLVEDVKELKLDILRKQIAGKIEINLPPTFINHMINEIETYEKILRDPDMVAHVLEDHYLWQADSKGHAIALLQMLDPTEKKLMKEIKKVKKAFACGFETTIEYIGYLRTGEIEFSAINKLNDEALLELLIFLKVLETMREERLDLKILGTLNVLLVDHIFRETVYAMKKILDFSGKKLDMPLDADRPRIEVEGV